MRRAGAVPRCRERSCSGRRFDRACGAVALTGWGARLRPRPHPLSFEVFAIQQGTLYPALQRHYYSLADAGRQQLDRERAAWERTVNGVNGVLNWAGGAE